MSTIFYKITKFNLPIDGEHQKIWRHQQIAHLVDHYLSCFHSIFTTVTRKSAML